MSINQIIIDIMAVFMAIGGIDRITHGKLKLGLSESFEEGFNALGALGQVFCVKAVRIKFWD